MNIFYLDNSPKICAEMHCDKHVVKMIIESAQLMSTAHRLLDGVQEVERRCVRGSIPTRWHHIKVWRHPDERFNEGLMRASHVNHPSNIWVRASKENYTWLLEMWRHLLAEYTYRYGKRHACEKYIIFLHSMPKNIPNVPFTEPTPAMPDECKIQGQSLASYHKYYIEKKVSFAKWTKREIPNWFLEGLREHANLYISQ
jgi:hypothetical protein